MRGSPDNASAESAVPPRRRFSPARRTATVAGYLALIFFLAEFVARAFWMGQGAPFFSCQNRLEILFYPQLGYVENQYIDRDDGYFDVLLLGGSVLHNDLGNVRHVLEEKLAVRTGEKVRVHNVAYGATTSLDSFYKYRHLDDKRFDLVVFYHSINEVRANNVPPGRYRVDYSHYSWYAYVNEFERKASRIFALPYTLKYAWIRLGEITGLAQYVPRHAPRNEWLQYGGDIKSARSLRMNLEKILKLARSRGERVLVNSYAWYVPENYNIEDFREWNLDYTTHWFSVETWGRPEYVVEGLKTHNRVLAEVAREYDNALFVDQARLMPKEGKYFNDVCHLTHLGCERLVDNMLPEVLKVAAQTDLNAPEQRPY